MAEAKKTTKKAAKEAELTVETVKENEAPEAMIEIEPEAKDAAKAGKRSAKSQREETAKVAKEARKAVAKADDAAKEKPVVKPARSKLERAGKKYREIAKQIDRTKLYPLAEAIELATKTSPVKFDASVELHINLGVDPRQADQNVRDNVVLPAGTGKKVRIAVLCEAEDEAKAKKAGADIVGAEAIFSNLDKEEIGFDVLIAAPSMMARLGKYARLLGPRGLMPNPKSGTVTANVDTAVSEAKAGKVEYRVDQAGIVHLAIGKASFTPAQLQQNAEAVLASIRAARPSSLKGIYIKSIYLSTTMGPSIKLEAQSA
jgi:large subunit ribosomal protein L1